MDPFVVLDLFCGAGGAGMGYYKAGYTVVGVDVEPQPHYPFDFVQADAFEYFDEHYGEFDLVHASPPCQAYSRTRHIPTVDASVYPKLIESLRERFIHTGVNYVIENVVGAPLVRPVMLCGVMFDLKVFRHRLFETYPFILGPAHVPHPKGSVTNSFRHYSSFATGATHISPSGHAFSRADALVAMDIDWYMNREEVAEAIPPAYTEYIGKQIKLILERKAKEKY